LPSLNVGRKSVVDKTDDMRSNLILSLDLDQTLVLRLLAQT